MQKMIHNLETGVAELVPMTAQEETEHLAKIAEHVASQEIEEAKPTPQKDLLAAAEAATTVEELRAVVVDLIALAFGVSK